MSCSWWRSWRRDLVVGSLSAVLTSLILVPIAWASHRAGQEQAEAARSEAEAAARRAEEKAAEVERQRSLTQKALVEAAADIAGFGDKVGAEIVQVSRDVISPEVPQGAWLLIDKKASSWAPGDIVVYRQKGLNYVGRVVAFDREAGRMTVARNGEKNRDVAASDLLGRGVLNSR